MGMMGGMSPAGRGDEVAAQGDVAERGEAAAPAQPLARDQLRASHQDRDRVVEILRVAAGDGRLTPEELDERLEAALTARTFAELAALTTDLPAVPGAAADAALPEPKDLVRIDCHSGSTKRDGRWVVPQRMEVRVTGGEVTLDFTEALVMQPTLRIDAEVLGGRLKLVTKPGIVVDTDDVTVQSSAVRIRAPWGPDVPVTLRVEVSGMVNGSQLTARPPRRPFWQWLLRRPRRYAIASR
jgi:hypothetical protein